MGLFTNPMTLVDAETTDRIFEFRAQLNEPNAVGGEYIEPAADVASHSKLIVKHSTSASGKKRHLLQRIENFDISADPTDGSDSVIVNLTVSHNIAATETQIANQIAIVKDALAEANFLPKFMREQL